MGRNGLTRHASSPEQWFVETSAMLSILLREPDGEEFARRIETSNCCTSAVAVFEMTLALSRQRTHSARRAHDIVAAALASLRIEIIPFTPEMISHAAYARERYGRGRKGLNMGDCLSYGAAKQLGLKLLYKGDDFAATDIGA